MKEVRDKPDGDDPGAVEEDVRRIRTIRGPEVLGYEGGPHEEHTGQTGGDEESDEMGDDLADNRPEQGDC